jgi:hypothetical protein
MVMSGSPRTATRTADPLAPATRPDRKFMRGDPMNPATKRFAGWLYNRSGEPACSTLPARNTTMRSAIVIASVWSCVT